VGLRYGVRPSAIVGLAHPATALLFDREVALRRTPKRTQTTEDDRYDDEGNCIDFSPIRR